jgi:hypothetical protein
MLFLSFFCELLPLPMVTLLVLRWLTPIRSTSLIGRIVVQVQSRTFVLGRNLLHAS